MRCPTDSSVNDSGTFSRRPLTRAGNGLALVVCIVTWCSGAEAADRSRVVGRRPEIMSGHFTGVVVTLQVERKLVASWLPHRLTPMETLPFPYPAGHHPVVVLFGMQRDLARHAALTLKPVYSRNGRYFREAFVMIPYLTFGGEPVLHPIRVYVNHPRPVSQGIRRDGWPKLLVAIDAHGGDYRIARAPFGTIFQAQTDDVDPQPFDSEDDAFVRFRTMFQQPLVLRHEGRFDRYRFDFHFESAVVRAVSSDVQLGEGFLPGLQPLSATVAPIDKDLFGAFSIDCRYTKTPIR